MRVVIAGAHGQVARRLGRLLSGRGDTAVGIVRNPDHVPDVEATGAAAVVLDLEAATAQELSGHLERALTSRAVIDQAKGMIMARLGVNADDAFARLVGLSSRLNVKVRDLAALMVEGHVDAVLRAAE